MIMLVPSSTAQMLSCGSTRTACANAKPYSPSPISRIISLGVEFEQARILAARIDEHVSFGIGRHADAFSQIKIRRKLQKVRHCFIGNFRHILRLGLGALLGGRQVRVLGELGWGQQQRRGCETYDLESAHKFSQVVPVYNNWLVYFSFNPSVDET